MSKDKETRPADAVRRGEGGPAEKGGIDGTSSSSGDDDGRKRLTDIEKALPGTITDAEGSILAEEAEAEAEAEEPAEQPPTGHGHVQDDWESADANPYNWSAGRKWGQIFMISSIAFAASLGTSILSPALTDLTTEFSVSRTVAILPLSLYVFALGLGPVVGGPLSETVGRYPVYMILTPLGGLFSVGAALTTTSFAGLCVLRFLAGFCLAPSLAVASGTITETFRAAERGLPSTVFILTPFLGPGFGPVIGAFAANRKGWRWTQWSLVFFIVFSVLVAIVFGGETFHPVLRRRWAKKLRRERLGAAGQPVGDEIPGESEKKPPVGAMMRLFFTVAIARPIHMLFTEPVVALVCLFVACEFATLFSFFAAVPFVFGRVYHFGVEDSGLIFFSVVVGCVLGAMTIVLCEVLLYRPLAPKYPPHMVPPEHRLYPAMIGSLGLPIGLFWFAWTSRPDISWASPAVAIAPFAWGNLCIFISLTQYLVDTYTGSVIASAMSANSLARYGLAAAFPLFTIQMYSNLGINWAGSLLAFIALALTPVPWVFFKYGKWIRAQSQYETSKA